MKKFLSTALLATVLIPARALTVDALVDTSSEVFGVASDLKMGLLYYTEMTWQGVYRYNPVTKQSQLLTSALNSPKGLVAARGGLAVADYSANKVYFVNQNGQSSVIAGSGVYGGVDGVGSAAQFKNPVGVTVDSNGILYVTDDVGLRMIDSSNRVTTVCTSFSGAVGVAVGNPGEIWVADTANHQIKLVTISGTNASVRVMAGTGYRGLQDDPRDGLKAKFYLPKGILWVGGKTGLLVSDTGNNVVRRLAYNGTSCSVETYATGFNSPIGLSMDNNGAFLLGDLKNHLVWSLNRDVLPLPTMAPASGTFSNAVTLNFGTSETEFATEFHYTTDGKSPTWVSPSGSQVVLDGGTTNNAVPLQMRCFSPDLMTSAVVSNNYQFVAAAPSVFPGNTVSSNDLSVKLSCPTEGAIIVCSINQYEPSLTNGVAVNPGDWIGLDGNCVLKTKAFKNGYAASSTVTNIYDFLVATPEISPSGATNFNAESIELSCDTEGADIYWTINGTTPTTNSTRYTGPFQLGSQGVFKAKAFKDGYTASDVASATFSYYVADTAIMPKGVTSNVPVLVTLTNGTEGAEIRWTIDGSDPAVNSTLYTGSFTLSTNGVLRARGFKAGFASGAIAQADYKLSVAPMVLTPTNAISFDSNVVYVNCETPNAVVRYTLDGSTPTASSPSFTNILNAPHALLVLTNTTLTLSATLDGMVPSPVLASKYQIQLSKPSMSPTNGYFPNGTMIRFATVRSDATIYYTLDGTAPTTNSSIYTGPIKMDQVSSQLKDVRVVRAMAAAPNTLQSDVVSGESVKGNQLGVPRDLVGGIGSTIVVPVVANVVEGKELRSVAFRFEVIPQGNAPALTKALENLTVTSNDFVHVVQETTDKNPLVLNVDSYQTNALQYDSVGKNLLVKNYGLIANIKLSIPKTAHEGDRYSLTILGASAAEDEHQALVPITPISATLVVSNLVYRAGDCSPGGWYNAGDFGSDALDIADVNAIFDASLGVNLPPSSSDVYKAMDVYPETSKRIGDGLVTYLDWQRVLLRAVGRDTNNWYRYWTLGGVLTNSATYPAFAVPASPIMARAAVAAVLETNDVWVPKAEVRVGTAENVLPGAAVNLPVYVNVLRGYSVAGLQFRAILNSMSSAPIPGALSFVTATVPQSRTRFTSSNEVLCGWDLGALPESLKAGTNLLGYLRFTVPATAQVGQLYSIEVLFADGAVDVDTMCEMEGIPGMVAVGAAAPKIENFISDDWKRHYFGGSTNADADADADPDGDGVSNWREYQAGTDPTKSESRLSLLSSKIQSVGQPVVLQWVSAPGRNYSIEASSDLISGKWASVVTGIPGDGGVCSFTPANPAAGAKFYRIRLQQP